MKKEKLYKILVSQAISIRKEVHRLLWQGAIKVNNIIEKKIDLKINPTIDEISILDKPLNFKKYIYIMMNKPQGILSASKDPTYKPVINLIPKDLKNGLFTAGRLDKDTEGLLIITNDGDFAHRMLSPKKKVYKIYEAIIDGQVTINEVKQFNKGILFKYGTVCQPAELKIIHSFNTSKVEISICKGNFHY